MKVVYNDAGKMRGTVDKTAETQERPNGHCTLDVVYFQTMQKSIKSVKFSMSLHFYCGGHNPAGILEQEI